MRLVTGLMVLLSKFLNICPPAAYVISAAEIIGLKATDPFRLFEVGFSRTRANSIMGKPAAKIDFVRLLNVSSVQCYVGYRRDVCRGSALRESYFEFFKEDIGAKPIGRVRLQTKGLKECAVCASEIGTNREVAGHFDNEEQIVGVTTEQ